MPTPMVEIASINEKSNNAEVQHLFMKAIEMEQQQRKPKVRLKKVSIEGRAVQFLVLEAERR